MAERYMRNRSGVVSFYTPWLMEKPELGFQECAIDGSDLIEAPEGATSDLLGGMQMAPGGQTEGAVPSGGTNDNAGG